MITAFNIYLFIVSYDSANKQKQYKEPKRNKETNCQ